MENIEIIREQIEDLEGKIAEIEDQARQKEVRAKQQLEAEYETQFDLAKEKYIDSNKKLESALIRYDDIVAKREDLKYKIKQTGKGKELLGEVIQKLKSEKARIDDLRGFIKAYPEYSDDLKKEMTKRLNITIKEITNEKKITIAGIKKDIKLLNKEISTLQKM